MKHRPLEPQRFIVMNLEAPILCPLCAVVVPEGGTHECLGPVHRQSREESFSYTTRHDWQTTSSFGESANAFTEKQWRDLFERINATHGFGSRRQQPPPPPPPPPREPTPVSPKEYAGFGNISLVRILIELAGGKWTGSADPASIAQAYRTAVQKHHPDHGGERQAFDQVIAIRDVLRARGVLA